MKVLITGSSGIIGTALSKALTAEGHSAISLQRQNNDPDSPVWGPEDCLKDLARVGGESIQSFNWQVKTLQSVVGVKQRKTVS